MSPRDASADPAQVEVAVDDPEGTRALGRALARHLRAGDLVMLRGALGAGKTTFAQGIGQGLHVRGHVSSPTYIVARVHPSLVGGPDLIHADAYRIRDLDDLETLDLDSTLADAVTVVEWGEGKTEAMSEERLEVDVTRPLGGEAHRSGGVIDLEDMDDGHRVVTLHPHGARWAGVLDDLAREAALVDGSPAEDPGTAPTGPAPTSPAGGAPTGPVPTEPVPTEPAPAPTSPATGEDRPS